MKQKFVLLALVFIAAMVCVLPVTANSIAVNGGSGQSATVGTAVATPPSVVIMNGTTPVNGVSVTFAVTSGGGTATGLTATTGSNGIATVGSWTLGTHAGANTMTATAAADNSPITFTATGIAGTATVMQPNSPTTQSAAPGATVSSPPSVILKDAYNNPVSGAAVTFTAASGSGTVTGGSQTTDTNGIATLTSWVLGTTAGTNTVTATSGTLTQDFTATSTGSTTASISTISPPAGARGKSVEITITGSGFTTTSGTVRLKRSGKENITATSYPVWNDTVIECKISKIPATADTGKWDVVVVTGHGEAVKADGFSITEPVTLTSITPESGQMGDDEVAFTLVGTNLDNTDSVYLYNADDEIKIVADDFNTVSSTKLTGKFNLEDQDTGMFEVCVVDDKGAIECDLSYEITTDEVGSIDVSSSPSGASIYVDGVLKGTTPDTLDDVVVGSHKIVVKMIGYQEWGRIVNLEADDTLDINADLYPVSTYAPTQTSYYQPTASSVRTTPVKTSTLKVPTSWPSATPTDTASPLNPAVVVAAVGLGLGLVMIRRR